MIPLDSGRYRVGQLTVQANTFQPGAIILLKPYNSCSNWDDNKTGCKLIISQSDSDVRAQKSDALDCTPELQLSSIAIDLSLKGSSDECKEEGFKHPVSLELYSEVA